MSETYWHELRTIVELIRSTTLHGCVSPWRDCEWQRGLHASTTTADGRAPNRSSAHHQSVDPLRARMLFAESINISLWPLYLYYYLVGIYVYTSHTQTHARICQFFWTVRIIYNRINCACVDITYTHAHVCVGAFGKKIYLKIIVPTERPWQPVWHAGCATNWKK